MRSLRGSARAIVALLAMAFLLPIMLAVLPSPANSAEAQLAHDLGVNVCAPQETSGGLPAAAHDHQQCCILCATGLPPVDGSHAAGLEFAPPLEIRATHHPLAATSPPVQPFFASVISLRGPPSRS